MISQLSSAAALYLAPILSLVSFLLALFVLLGPVVILHSQVALMVISPSSPFANASSSPLDGPLLRFGLLGSCGQSALSQPLNCTVPSFSPFYDTSYLPDSSDPELIDSLPPAAPAFVLVALILSTIFFLMFAAASAASRLGKLAPLLNKPLFSRATVWIGVLGFMLGAIDYLILRLWFGKLASDFNKGIAKLDSHAPQLTASVGNAFTMVWVAHAFAAVPLVCAMTKLHISRGSGPSGKA